MSESKRILIFTGDGKGKTTAAMGMALRAAGHGLAVLVVQFVKSNPHSGEATAMRAVPGVEWFQCGRGFIPRRGEAAREEHAAAARAAFAVADDALQTGRYGVVVLDEICVAVAAGLLDESVVAEGIRHAAAGTVVVLTGRGATPGLLELADTVTEMRVVRHGYQAGIAAQVGVEY
jgi:cob(I)alamin adenosyltransferase